MLKRPGFWDGSCSNVRAYYRGGCGWHAKPCEDCEKPCTTQDRGCSLPRSGRPMAYNDRCNRIMLRHLRLNPKAAFEARRLETGLEMSNTYNKNIAKAARLGCWRTKRWPELSKDVTSHRLLWCRLRDPWGIAEWKNTSGATSVLRRKAGWETGLCIWNIRRWMEAFYCDNI